MDAIMNAIEKLEAGQEGYLPGFFGFEWIRAEAGLVEGRLRLERRHLAPNGYLHAAAVVALADSACGFGCQLSLPAAATGFTTVELKTNFIGTARDGSVTCRAKLAHAGKTTQVWDASVKSEPAGKTIALFRCTQILLYS